MSAPIGMTVGPEDAVRVVLGELKKYAASGKLPPLPKAVNLRRYGDIDVFFDMHNVGEARFHFVTADNIEIDFVVDFTTLDRDSLSEIKQQVIQGMFKARAERNKKDVAVIK